MKGLMLITWDVSYNSHAVSTSRSVKRALNLSVNSGHGYIKDHSQLWQPPRVPFRLFSLPSKPKNQLWERSRNCRITPEKLRSEASLMFAKHRPPGEPGPSRWCYASLDPCWLFVTVLYDVDAVDGIILELVVSIKTYTRFLCPGSGTPCFFSSTCSVFG